MIRTFSLHGEFIQANLSVIAMAAISSKQPFISRDKQVDYFRYIFPQALVILKDSILFVFKLSRQNTAPQLNKATFRSSYATYCVWLHHFWSLILNSLILIHIIEFISLTHKSIQQQSDNREPDCSGRKGRYAWYSCRKQKLNIFKYTGKIIKVIEARIYNGKEFWQQEKLLIQCHWGTYLSPSEQMKKRKG